MRLRTHPSTLTVRPAAWSDRIRTARARDASRSEVGASVPTSLRTRTSRRASLGELGGSVDRGGCARAVRDQGSKEACGVARGQTLDEGHEDARPGSHSRRQPVTAATRRRRRVKSTSDIRRRVREMVCKSECKGDDRHRRSRGSGGRNTELPATKRLRMPWTRQSLSTTPCLGSSCMRVVPI